MLNNFSKIKPTNLKCEYKINPSSIDEKYPRFSWITDYKGYNSFQTSYKILVATSIKNLQSLNGDIWDSGKVNSSESNNIQFNGIRLHSNTTYYWQVMIWNEKNESSLWSEPTNFSTGLFEQSEWKAKWISHIYKNQQEDSISFHSKKDKWIWFPYQNPEDKFRNIYLYKTFNLKKINCIKSANLIVTADEKFKLYFNGKLIAQSDNKIYSWTRPVDCDVINLLNEGKNILQVEGMNSYVEKPGFILRMEIKFKSGKKRIIFTNKKWKSTLKDENNFCEAVEVAIAGEKPWRVPKSKLEFNPAAYFKKTFKVNKKTKRAFIYCSALGLYHLNINNKNVTDDLFTPGWSNFNKNVYYNSYEITSLIRKGNNTVNIILADGYYSGYCGWERGRNYYGKFPAIKIQLMINYDDGTEEIISTDKSWLSAEGPVREADILMGEFFDSDYEPINSTKFKKIIVRTDVETNMKSYKANEIKIRCELKTISIHKIDDNKFIVDFGQNFAGYVKLKLRNTKKKIIFRFAEILNDDGTLYTENIRMARAQDTYISRGDKTEIWQPLFTYHGFRYVEITGLNKIEEDTITGISINSLPEQTASFNSSNKKLNKLFECILWNQRSNYLDIPTDCPQRDERLGWTGDAVSFFKTAAFNYDVSAFYSKWFENLFDEQKNNGELPPFAPLPDLGVGPIYFNSAGWADVGIITPFLFYQFYNDISLLEKYYQQMKSFINSLEKMSDNFILDNFGYGDWLCIGEETSKSYIATAYFSFDCFLMSKIASLLRYNEDAVHYKLFFYKIKKSFRKKFLNKDGSLKNLTQTAAVLSIHFGLLNSNEKQKAINFLVNDIIEKDYHITTGFLGLSFLMQVLSAIGRNDIAFKVLTNNEFPSWFYMINNGSTTLWERWDSYHSEKGFFEPTMNSFNHCSLGCIGEWLFTNLAGINSLESGFKKILLKPYFPEKLNFVRASFQSINGLFKSEWQKDRNDLFMKIQIPFNTSVVISLPSNKFEIIENHFEKKIMSKSKDLELGSGYYKIHFKLTDK
ncbi:MAG: family 78 glycoside hydrolase catalytic domain [Ignavibacterium sp.]